VRDDAERLQDILDAIGAIQAKVGEVRSDFDANPMLRVWCLHHATIIGEAASRLSSEFRDKHPEVPWRGMIGMRNAVVHGYFSVDWDELWAVIERDLEPLRRAVESILRG
jgi:uncharacterized protein with HEPN domain